MTGPAGYVPERRLRARTPTTSVVRVGGWLVLLAVVLAVLTAGAPRTPPVAPAQWGGWLRSTPPVEVAFAVVRLAAIVTVWYLAAATVVGLGVRLVRAPRLTAATDRLTVPPVRRVLAGLGMATMGLTSGAAPFVGSSTAVAAQAPVTVTVTTEAGRPNPESTVTMRRLPPTDEAAPAAVAPAEPTPPPAGDRTDSWTVAPGECFWTIADQVLTRAWGRPAADQEIVPYWKRLIEANRAALADPSNPDLLYVGQTFTVPAP